MIKIRMSQSGYCPRRLSAMLLGREASATPTWLASSASEGVWHEARMKQELIELGCEVVDEQRELQAQGEGFTATGHIDGCIKLTPKLLESPLFTIHYVDCTKADITFDKFHLLEVKSFSFLEHQRFLSEFLDGYYRSYASQHTLYRNALSSPLSVLATKDRSGGARNIYFIGRDPVPIIDVMAQLKLVAASAEKGDLVDVEFDAESLECRRCNYRTTECAKHLPMVEEAEMVQASRDYRDGKDQENMGKALADQAKETLVAYAKRKGIKRWVSAGWPVTYSNFPRETISIKGLEEIMPRSHFESAISTSIVERITVVDSSKES